MPVATTEVEIAQWTGEVLDFKGSLPVMFYTQVRLYGMLLKVSREGRPIMVRIYRDKNNQVRCKGEGRDKVAIPKHTLLEKALADGSLGQPDQFVVEVEGSLLQLTAVLPVEDRSKAIHLLQAGVSLLA